MGRKTNFRLVVYCYSSTNSENLSNIGPVDFEISHIYRVTMCFSRNVNNVFRDSAVDVGLQQQQQQQQQKQHDARKIVPLGLPSRITVRQRKLFNLARVYSTSYFEMPSGTKAFLFSGQFQIALLFCNILRQLKQCSHVATGRTSTSALQYNNFAGYRSNFEM